MADASDVSNVLAAMCASTIYPGGTAQPGLIPQEVMVYVGWPDKATLDADLQMLNAGNPLGRVHVSIYPRPNEQVTTKYRATQTVLQTYNAPTITTSIVGQTITLGGTVSAPQNVALIVGGKPYAYAVQPADTLASIATALSVQITGATSAGPSITVPAGLAIAAARSGGAGTVMQLVRRQRREWQVTIWAHSDAVRNALAAPLDNVFAGARFVSLPDQTSGRLLYVQTMFDDKRSQAQLYRRDLIYSVEYDTTQVYAAADVVVTELTIGTGVSGTDATVSTLPPIYQ